LLSTSDFRTSTLFQRASSSPAIRRYQRRSAASSSVRSAWRASTAALASARRWRHRPRRVFAEPCSLGVFTGALGERFEPRWPARQGGRQWGGAFSDGARRGFAGVGSPPGANGRTSLLCPRTHRSSAFTSRRVRPALPWPTGRPGSVTTIERALSALTWDYAQRGQPLDRRRADQSMNTRLEACPLC
jgi:hypothetical protein